ncbi:hypothetical protein Tco_0399879 [Tanacetum coccineum]
MKLNDEPPTWIMKAIGRILEEGMVPEANTRITAPSIEREIERTVDEPVVDLTVRLEKSTTCDEIKATIKYSSKGVFIFCIFGLQSAAKLHKKVEKALSNVEMKNRVSIPVMAWVLQLKQDKLAKKGSGKGFRILRYGLVDFINTVETLLKGRAGWSVQKGRMIMVVHCSRVPDIASCHWWIPAAGGIIVPQMRVWANGEAGVSEEITACWLILALIELPGKQSLLGCPSVAPTSQEIESIVGFILPTAILQIYTTLVGVMYNGILKYSAWACNQSKRKTSTQAKLSASIINAGSVALVLPHMLESERGQKDYPDGFAVASSSSPPAPSSLLFVPYTVTKYITEFNVGGKATANMLGSERKRLEDEILRCRALKVTKLEDHDFLCFDSRSNHLESALNDAQVACTEAGTKITSLASERDRLVSEVSSLRAGFKDFKEKMEVQQEEQAQELYSHVAELEAHVMDVSDRLEGEFYPTYLTLLARRRWLLTHGIQLVILKCLKSSEYQGILGHALGWDVDFGMQEGLEAGHEHGVAGRSLSMVDAYNPKAARASYVDAVKALEDASFPLVDLLKSKKDVGMDEALDCFLLDGPLAGLSEAAYLRPCIEQLSIPIHHAGDKTAIGETSLSFALMNVHARTDGAKKHAAALRQLMMEIVSAPLSSQTWVGEASTSAAPLSVEDYTEEDTDEALGSVVAVPKLECCHF